MARARKCGVRVNKHRGLNGYVKATLRRRLNGSIPQMGAYLEAVVRGHTQYYDVPLNSRAIDTFRYQVGRIWRWVLGRRSQRTHATWARIQRLSKRWRPPAHVCHPYPIDRFVVRTRGRSAVQSFCPPGSVRGPGVTRVPTVLRGPWAVIVDGTALHAQLGPRVDLRSKVSANLGSSAMEST